MVASLSRPFEVPFATSAPSETMRHGNVIRRGSIGTGAGVLAGSGSFSWSPIITSWIHLMDFDGFGWILMVQMRQKPTKTVFFSWPHGITAASRRDRYTERGRNGAALDRSPRGYRQSRSRDRGRRLEWRNIRYVGTLGINS